MYYRKPYLIEEEIEDVKEIIRVNENLIPQFPNDFVLKSNLEYLKEREVDLRNELMISNDHYNVDYVSITINKENPPIKDVLAISDSLQNLIYPLAQAYEGPVKRGSRPSLEIKNATTLGLAKAESGSLRLYFKTDPLKTDPQKKFVTLVRTAMDNLTILLSCGTDKNLIKKQTKRLGTQCIDKYKEFLGKISEKELDLKLFDLEKPKDYEPQHITKDFAENVYQVIIETNPPTEENVLIEGELGVIDTFSHIFKIKDLNDKIIHVKFDEHYIEQVKSRLKQKIIAELKVTKKYHKIEDKTEEERELLRFIE